MKAGGLHFQVVKQHRKELQDSQQGNVSGNQVPGCQKCQLQAGIKPTALYQH